MELLTLLGYYSIFATAIASTGYFRLFRPAALLVDEIVEQKTPHSGILHGIIWLLFSALVAPWIAVILLKNNNNEFIEDLAVSLANRIIDEE